MERLNEMIYIPVADLNCEVYWSKEPIPFEKRTEGVRNEIAVGQRWGELFDCGWFHLTGQLPDAVSLEDLVIRFDISGEALLYDDSGTPVMGLTNLHSIFDQYWGCTAKRELPAHLCTRDGN